MLPTSFIRVLTAMALVLGGLTVIPAPEPAAIPDWVTELEGSRGKGQANPVPWRESSPPAPLAKSVGIAPPQVRFPEAQKWDVPQGVAATSQQGRVVRLAPKETTAVGDALTVEVLDRATSQKLGASGFAFRTSGNIKGGTEVSIDYSGFANAYGADYKTRLRIAKVTETGTLTILPSTNDTAAQRLTFETDADGAGTFAVISAIGGEAGTFAASDLALSSSWNVAPGSGAFTYSYPIDVPAPAGGSAPTVALGYSSAAIDGLTLARNTQASPAGVGWSDFANAFIERRYEPCFRSFGTMDLCWMSENATISLGGISGPLIPVNASFTEWRAQSDPGWKIERLTGAPYTSINQGQYWKVTGPDGTQYFFGFGHMPGRTTNSILEVPVAADNSGEPCRGPGDAPGSCYQGWRWYLDRVVDPDGNVQTYLYEREDNWFWSYLGALGGQPMSHYHRAALLKEIIYGGRADAWDESLYSARVTFGLQWRCYYLVDVCPPVSHGHTGFPDVPTDLVCAPADQDSCTANNGPSFFSAMRYGWVRTEVKVGSEWKYVAQHNIIHGWGDGLNAVSYKLQVNELQHAAIAFGKLNAYPTTKFGYQFRDNRADHSGDVWKAMRHNRINSITNPFGGVTTVVYNMNRFCDPSYNAYPRWDLNDRDCFPQSIKDGDHLRTGVFHKYLVTRVVESAGLGSPNVSTTYTYEGTPAWGFDSGAFSRDEDETGWSVWRGYGTVLITKGTAKTRVRVFRGWDGDPMLVLDGGNWVPLGRRTVTVAGLTSTTAYTDHPGLGGRVLEEAQLGVLNGVADSVIMSRRYEYERRITFDVPPTYRFDPEWARQKSTTESVFSAPGVSRQRRSQTTYNAYLQPTTTLEEGWLDVTGDERCSITTYAVNPTTGMYTYPAANKTVGGNCASTNVLSQSETYYDNSTVLGAAPVKGNATKQRTQIDATRWAETTTEYDAMGRPTRATDARGGATTTVYGVTAGAPYTQIPIRTTVTNGLGQQVITDFHPEFGIPKREQDINGNVTEYWYDEFGRMTGVWLPTEPVAYAHASFWFAYDIPNRVVRTQKLSSESRTENVTFDEGWVVYDGFWRERQSQGVSPVAGKALVSETTYDNRGLVADETVEQAQPGTPGTYISATSWANRTRHSYDELGREVRKEWLRGTSVAHATTTSYGIDNVTVTGPDGRRVRERLDGHGRTTAVDEFDGAAWVSAVYSYDLANRLTSVTDPAGARTTYTYNLAGWRTGQADPDRGTATFTYDVAGNQTSAVDALGNQIHNIYDSLGRQVERRAGSPTGTLLAKWTFDTAPGGKGKPHTVTTYNPSGAWVSEVLGYDSKGRAGATKLTVPAGIPGLSGSYTVKQNYDRADRVKSIEYPAMGGLPAETITTEYDTLGQPTRMFGAEEYVWGVAYDDRGRQVSAGIGPRPGGTTWMAKRWTFDVDQRLNGTQTLINNAEVSNHQLVFDSAGNLTQKLTRQGALTWRECFGYDARARLTSAHTVAVTTDCATGTRGTGDRPYNHTYGYSPDGKLLQRNENGAVTSYTYGGAKPHAPSNIGGVAYTWDGRGSLLSRGGQTFSWDVQGMLRSVTAASGTTSFEYDAAGQRLLRKTSAGLTTLYVAGHEMTANAAGTLVTAVRSYTFDGDVIATRTGAGIVEYLISDPAGSVETAYASGATTPLATRAYKPYGQVRAQTGDTATDRGFLGQIEDASTGLSYLNARYYDAAVGLFISTDPLYDTKKPKSLNPYSYATNNPASFSDPGGMLSAYTFGVETENARLRQYNSELVAHIGRLENHIEQLQDVVRQQQKTINKLVSYIRALEAEIERQASIIRQLQARIAYLQRVVVAQQREISRLRYVVARQQQIIRYQAGVIRYQAGVISYYKGVVNVLGFRLWGGTPQYAWVMNSIHSFRGIPAGAFNYDRISILQATVAAKDAVISRLMSRGAGGGGGSYAAMGGAGSSAGVDKIQRVGFGTGIHFYGGGGGDEPPIEVNGSNGSTWTPGSQPPTGTGDSGCPIAGRNPNGSCRGGEMARNAGRNAFVGCAGGLWASIFAVGLTAPAGCAIGGGGGVVAAVAGEIYDTITPW
ncbi:MAG TPA: RHS repeat-associated core domain-containing protein [Candidatus Limnocylindrales bacterium]|nr:RHS repeat-associated core domain-containing protein [Candidatus Limnocylindrales bacterium]